MCSCTMVDGWNNIAGRSLAARANGGLSDLLQRHGAELPDRIALIKAQFSTLDTATERGRLDKTEVTHLHACARPADK